MDGGVHSMQGAVSAGSGGAGAWAGVEGHSSHPLGTRDIQILGLHDELSGCDLKQSATLID